MVSATKRIVSSENEQLILVNEADEELGHMSKQECHDGDGVLHRAFSLFIFNSAGELLLQRRAAGKRLWPLFWSNSCCSHPRKDESMEQATGRRLMDELNIGAELQFVYKFSYQAIFDDRGSEHELCWVYVGRCDRPVVPNESEIAEWRFVQASVLDAELANSPERFTPWFRLEWGQLRSEYGKLLATYTEA